MKNILIFFARNCDFDCKCCDEFRVEQLEKMKREQEEKERLEREEKRSQVHYFVYYISFSQSLLFF
jgi:hypothetical protein